MHEHFFTERGLYYRTNDFLPNRETLVFVHGLSGSSSAWKQYEEKFKDTHNILTFDLRGHGKSVKPKKYDDYAIKKFADDLVALLNHCNITTCVLVSHSFAGLIVLEFLKTHQPMVKKLIFLSPSYHARGGIGARFIDPLLSVVHVLGLFPHSKKTGTHIDYTKYPNSGDWNIPRMIADVGNTGLTIYLYCSKQALRVNYKDLLHTLSVPTLLIHGGKDSIFPWKNSTFMHHEIKNSTLIFLENADHIVVLNYFEQVSKAIETFLVG